MPKELPIRILGDEILRTKSREVDLNEPGLKEFIKDLSFTMYLRDGVGLAANQVGQALRIFVIDPYWAREEEAEMNPIVMINPEILSGEGEQVYEEGCISLPDIYANVQRPNKIEYRYMDEEGKVHTKQAEGYEAVVIQHEYDHLEGVVFTDHLGTLSRLRVLPKLKALESRAVDGVNIRSKDE
ncbi:MAG: peptide deformylase [Candidatus Cloacimonetes bacterium]|nr:peptide deformylase [Candidatus Cloacimonadota bacterium]